MRYKFSFLMQGCMNTGPAPLITLRQDLAFYHIPQKKSTMICAVNILRNMLNG